MSVQWIKSNSEWISIIGVSTLGSLKAITYTKKSKIYERLLDFAVGIVCGMLVGFYVVHDMGFIAALIVALMSAVSGVLILESVLTNIPMFISEYIKSKTTK